MCVFKAWCQAVRRGFAVPTVLEILAADFSSTQLLEPYNGTVTITSERGEVGLVPLQLGTDYEVPKSANGHCTTLHN